MLDALAAGADDYVVKSTDPEVWRARVRALIRRKSFEDEARRAREEQMARELAATRAALLEDLKRKNKELEAFSYSVSHDLRAPLRAIDGFSRALEEDYAERLDETGREHLRRVRAAAARMRDLIDDLLRLSRISRAELRREGVDLSALAGTVIAALEKSGGERKVEFVIDPELNADADRRMLQVVLENLFGNAWKFTSKTAQPRIELGKKEQDGETIHFLRDNGVGFDMGHAGKLFAPFQRLHAEADFPGTGIGLATVYRIIDRHGGRIWAESSPGKGATFFFTLPPAKR
jgi:light-regulated signal transduction histidine kinase (bacteriophytochrome)